MLLGLLRTDVERDEERISLAQGRKCENGTNSQENNSKI